MPRISSQAALMFSHMSEVMRPRTAWALLRARRRQLNRLAGLSSSRAKKCSMRSALSWPWHAR